MHPSLVVPSTLLLVSLASCGAGPTAPGADPDPQRGAAPAGPVPLVVALGDSLTAGPGIHPSETYPARLQERAAAQGYRHRIVNAGISGDTTAGGLRRLDRALEPDTRVLILALGANDGLAGVPVEEVRRNLAGIIERAQARGILVLLCGMETPPTHGWRYTLDFHFVFPELAARYGIPLMPFLLAGVVGEAAYNLPDGVHPNAAGAARIAGTMWPYLEPLLAATNGG